MSTPELIVMLTKNDHTAENALEVFESCKDTRAKCWGAKEQGIPLQQMKKLYDAFREYGKTSFLEVVAYNEKECIDGAKLAVQCGCDVLMGTLFFDSVCRICRDNGIKYMPFVGKVSGRPSILNGTAQEMILEARERVEKGAWGIDLLGYRYTEDGYRLSKEVVRQCRVPVCLAGSIDSFSRLDQVMEIAPDFFTIGGAFFDGKFGQGFDCQINRVCDYIRTPATV